MTVRHVRHSKLIEAEATDMDARVGYWTRAEVVAMDERFCAAMRRALTRAAAPAVVSGAQDAAGEILHGPRRQQA